MSLAANMPSPLIPPEALGKAIARRGHVWQMDFLSADQLATFVGDRGLKFWSRHIIQLWQMGILRADYVVQSDRTRRVGFRYMGTDRDGRHVYADIRRCRSFPQGWASSAPGSSSVDRNVEPYFHGFRYLVLCYLDSVLRFSPLPNQSLPPSRYFHELLDEHLQQVMVLTSSAESSADVDKWNDIASLAVLCEPNIYIRIFGSLRRPSYISDSLQRLSLNEHWNALAAIYRAIGLDRIRTIREELCWETHMLEPNEDVHTLLCLAGKENRLKLEGRLGGALVVRTMTEMIRRAAEEVFKTELPEEDEHPVHFRATWIKQNMYGSGRLLDNNNWAAADEFTRTFGLRFGPHVRWYVEGETEDGAVCRLLSLLGAHDVAVVNLQGRIKERKKNEFASSLLAALKADRAARIFSFISIDEDRKDNLKVIRLAAQRDDFCGNFFISSPNIECHNFTKDELEDILWKVALDEGAARKGYGDYKIAVQPWDYDQGNTNSLFDLARNTLKLYSKLKKDGAWGRRLMDYAWEHPVHPNGTLRDILQTMRALHIARTTNYHLTERDYRVDPNTGGMIKRSEAD